MIPNQEQETKSRTNWRINLIAVALLVACSLLGIRLWQLQVVRWGEFKGMADANRLRMQHLEAPRGIIYGRNGMHDAVPLADNRPGGDIVIVPAECDDIEAVTKNLIAIAGIESGALLEKIEKARATRQTHRQIVVRADAPHGVLARIEEYAALLPGVSVNVQPHRRYPYGKAAGQILGYIGEIGPDELAERKDVYRMGDRIGRSGLERRYEEILRGESGSMLVTQYAAGEPQLRTDAYGRPYVEVDSFGHRLFEEKVQEPVIGDPLYVTLDIGLQMHLEQLLDGEHGAIVVLDASTGGVLAMASNPTYDPTVFVKPGSIVDWASP